MNELTMKPTLLYLHDPMCSWCWGYHPTWKQLQDNLLKNNDITLDVKSLLGGLAPDSDEPMAENMQTFLQQTWQKINQQLGTKFNFDFWQDCQPRRSTYPACRAVIAAREQGREQAMILAIQKGYYLHAQNPSDSHVLIDMASSIGLDVKQFSEALTSESVNAQLLAEIAMVRSLPINGFPSLVLSLNGQFIAIEVNYTNWKISYDNILSHLYQID